MRATTSGSSWIFASDGRDHIVTGEALSTAAPRDAPRRRRRTRGLVTGLGGAVLLVWLIRDAGVADLTRRLAVLGPSLPLALVPYTVASLLDALGWRAVLRAFDMSVPFTRLWLVRLAGEAVNSIVPTGIGGEPLKAVMLRGPGASGSAVAASVVVSRTALTVAQALLVVLGVGAVCTRLGWTFAAPAVVAALLLCTAAFGLLLVRAQERGLVLGLARGVAWFLPAERARFRLQGRAAGVDRCLATVYRRERRALLAAGTWHMLAWLATAAEVWVLLRLLKSPVPWRDVLIIEGLAQPIRATGVVVPGALGTQEGGGMAVCRWLGIAPGVALTLWLARRGREIVFDVIGLVYVAARNLSRHPDVGSLTS